MKIRMILILALAVYWSRSPAAVASAPSPGLDVNDVSVLFPLGNGFRPAPEITLAEVSANGALLDATTFHAILDYAKKTENVFNPVNVREFDAPSGWVVVGFRYDPCAPPDDSRESSGCAEELRLVAQPMSLYGGPADSALHLVYRLSERAPTADSAALRDLVDIRDRLSNEFGAPGGSQTAGLPLGAHPVLSKAVDTAPNWPTDARAKLGITLYRDFVTTHARAGRLTHLTLMALKKGASTDWIFLGGTVAGTRWTPAAIPNLPNGKDLSIRFDRTDFRFRNTETRIEPSPTDPRTSVARLFEIESNDFEREGPLNRDLAAMVHRVENPRLTHRNNVDCLSCHLVTTARLHAPLPLFLPEWSFVPPPRITGYVDPSALANHPTQWNLRNFGYFNTQPSVSIRTAHESALAADAANRILALTGPGRDCSGVAAPVAVCLSAPLADAKACLAACTP